MSVSYVKFIRGFVFRVHLNIDGNAVKSMKEERNITHNCSPILDPRQEFRVREQLFILCMSTFSWSICTKCIPSLRMDISLKKVIAGPCVVFLKVTRCVPVAFAFLVVAACDGADYCPVVNVVISSLCILQPKSIVRLFCLLFLYLPESLCLHK